MDKPNYFSRCIIEMRGQSSRLFRQVSHHLATSEKLSNSGPYQSLHARKHLSFRIQLYAPGCYSWGNPPLLISPALPRHFTERSYLPLSDSPPLCECPLRMLERLQCTSVRILSDPKHLIALPWYKWIFSASCTWLLGESSMTNWSTKHIKILVEHLKVFSGNYWKISFSLPIGKLYTKHNWIPLPKEKQTKKL